jgi:mRNA interferase RelE/StbE
VYKIVFKDEVLKQDLPKLPKTVLKLVKKAITERLEVDPISYGKPLRYSLKGHRRIRVGDYRIVYTIEAKTVIITTIRHRKDVYE